MSPPRGPYPFTAALGSFHGTSKIINAVAGGLSPGLTRTTAPGSSAPSPRWSRPPDSADAVIARHDPLVFRRIDGLIRLDIVVTFAVAVGIEDERRPTLRLLFVAGFVEHLRVEPAEGAAGGPPLESHSVLLASSAKTK